jgi:hypothetical protein
VAARRGIPFFAAGVYLEIEFRAGRPRRAAPTVRSEALYQVGNFCGKCIAKYHRTFERSVKILRQFVCFLDVFSWYPKRQSGPVYEYC